MPYAGLAIWGGAASDALAASASREGGMLPGSVAAFVGANGERAGAGDAPATPESGLCPTFPAPQTLRRRTESAPESEWRNVPHHVVS